MQHPPEKVVYTEKCESKADAVWRKLQLKKGSRAKKEALIADNIEELKKLSKK
jgi:predicted GIY-YIG superfamily endonuclease